MCEGLLPFNDLCPEGFLEISKEVQTSPWVLCWALGVAISTQTFHHLPLEFVSVLSLIQSQRGLEDFPFSFPALHIPLSYKYYFFRRDKLPSGISCLISELILVFLYLQIFLKASGKSHTPSVLELSNPLIMLYPIHISFLASSFISMDFFFFSFCNEHSLFFLICIFVDLCHTYSKYYSLGAS